MGSTTPNMGIYVPVDGEENYSESFEAGMINIDQHDHSGGPNQGVPIGTTALADNSVTYKKLAANVADNTTGIGTSAILQNQLIILGILKNIFQLSTVTTGFLVKNGILAIERSFDDSSSVVWLNRDGASANPQAFVDFNAAVLLGTANQIKVTPTGSPPGRTATISLEQWVVNPSQPAFSASAAAQASKTGDGTAYQVLFSTKLFDQLPANYSTIFNTFQAPVNGIYNMGFSLLVSNIPNTTTDGAVDFYINGVKQFGPFLGDLRTIRDTSNNVEISCSQLMKLTALDLVSVVITATISGGSPPKQIGVSSGNFYGYLVC